MQRQRGIGAIDRVVGHDPGTTVRAEDPGRDTPFGRRGDNGGAARMLDSTAPRDPMQDAPARPARYRLARPQDARRDAITAATRIPEPLAVAALLLAGARLDPEQQRRSLASSRSRFRARFARRGAMPAARKR